MPRWYDAPADIHKGYIFNFIIGGRGIGKTYGLLEYMMKNGYNFIYLRRSNTEIKVCSREAGNPFKKLNDDLDCYYFIEGSEEISVIRYLDEQENKHTIGYAAALSTFSNMRGVDFSDIEYIIFDEFVPQNETRKLIKNELEAFLNFYETVNRNRELLGQDPVRVFFLSNAVSIASPILTGLDLTKVIEKMIKKDQRYYYNQDKSIMIHLPFDSEFAAEKGETFLYKLTSGMAFSKHALQNMFAYDSFFNVKSKNIKEYTPVCAYDNMYIYKHKTGPEYYVCYARADCPVYDADSKDLFRRKYGIKFKTAIIEGRMIFSEYSIKTLLSEIVW